MDNELREQMREMFKSGWFLERGKRSLRAIDEDAAPGWLDDELREALDLIQPPHQRKKRTTVIRIAEAKASGVSIQHVFEAEDCCSAPIWYTRRNPFYKLGWSEQPDIMPAIALAESRAQQFYDNLEQERLNVRRHILTQTEHRLAEISVASAEVLLDIMLDPESASDTRRKAAVDVLTHAAPETAPKSQGDDGLHLTIDTTGPSMRDIRNRARKLPDRTITVEGEPQEEPAMEIVVGGDGPPPPPPGGLKVPTRGLYDAPPPLVSDNGDGEEEQEGDA